MPDDGMMRIEYGGKVYEVDLNDLDGREMGVFDRFRTEHGPSVGTIYAGLLIGKRRAGEQFTEDDVLAVKWGEISNPDVAEATPDPPAPRRERGGK